MMCNQLREKTYFTQDPGPVLLL
uniref:Uncharacterized protein n=1 Tax=Rhizophora mucronata TaxID=61149 RepID=A0A2P2L505_RHIMU